MSQLKSLDEILGGLMADRCVGCVMMRRPGTGEPCWSAGAKSPCPPHTSHPTPRAWPGDVTYLADRFHLTIHRIVSVTLWGSDAYIASTPAAAVILLAGRWWGRRKCGRISWHSVASPPSCSSSRYRFSPRHRGTCTLTRETLRGPVKVRHTGPGSG